MPFELKTAADDFKPRDGTREAVTRTSNDRFSNYPPSEAGSINPS